MNTNTQDPLARLLALKQVLEEYQAKGEQSVPIESVLHQIGLSLGTLQPLFSTPQEANIEKYKAELTAWLATNQHRLDWVLENFRQTLGLAQTATKYIVLIHGGAAVALLGFLSRVWQPGAGEAIRPFANSVAWFAAGLFGAAFGALLSYVVQLLYGYTEDQWKLRLGTALHVVTFLIALGTFGALYGGIATAYQGFVTTETSLELRPEAEDRQPIGQQPQQAGRGDVEEERSATADDSADADSVAAQDDGEAAAGEAPEQP